MMPSLPAALNERLRKLLLMLSSSEVGERAAAAAAIDRMLRDNGMDWHDLAGKLTAPPAATATKVPARAGEGESSLLNATDVMEVIDEIFASKIRLSRNSREFLDQMALRADTYRSVFFSEKQRAWLENLAADADVPIPWS